MSQEIQKTNTTVIRQETFGLISYLDTIRGKDTELDIIKKKFPVLYHTSPTLFNHVLNNYSKTRNNRIEETKFKYNLDMLLSGIENVQKGKVTHTEASGKVGVHLAHTYIPNFENMR
jgi:hypothetical protein